MIGVSIDTVNENGSNFELGTEINEVFYSMLSHYKEIIQERKLEEK